MIGPVRFPRTRDPSYPEELVMWTDPGSTAPQYFLDQLVLVDLDVVFGPPPADAVPHPRCHHPGHWGNT